jgi:hypothetical protein
MEELQLWRQHLKKKWLDWLLNVNRDGLLALKRLPQSFELLRMGIAPGPSPQILGLTSVGLLQGDPVRFGFLDHLVSGHLQNPDLTELGSELALLVRRTANQSTTKLMKIGGRLLEASGQKSTSC